MNRMIFLLLLITGIIIAQSGSTRNVMDYGAVADGKTINTASIQKAVDDASVNGGTVIFPAGKYLTGSIELKSNVDIYLAKGAVILGSTKLSDYFERVYSIKAYNNFFLKHSLFYAHQANNLSIRGEGTIDGQGFGFKVFAKEKPARYMNRPYIFRFSECKNLKVEGISLQNPAMWTQHYFACEDVIVRGIRVYSHANKNNDMIDIDGCKNFIMSDCFGDSDDDAITLKSTSERITENISITNCVVSSHCNAIKLGTESTGGFKNITISNIVVKPSRADTVITGRKEGISAISVEMVDGGILDGINISDITIEGTEVPIFIRLGDRGRLHYEGAPTPKVGSLSNVSISNVIARNTGSIGCSITGLETQKVNGISLNNISIESAGGVLSYNFSKPVEELTKEYPEATMFGVLPAYGFYIRHAERVMMNNIKFTTKVEDIRPVITLDDVENSSINLTEAEVSLSTKSFFKIINSQNVSLVGNNSIGQTKTFVEVAGKQTKHIYIANSGLSKYTLPIIYNDVSKNYVKVID